MATIDKIVTETKSESALLAKQALNNFVVKINKQLVEYFDNELTTPFGVSNDQKELSKHIWEHIKEHNLRPCKRLRASFVYYGYKLMGGTDIKNIMDAAMSVEIVHTALLMHDDFMDMDDTRRGEPTTHKYYSNIHKEKYESGEAIHYGDSMAMTVGDVALLSGYEILGRSEFSADAKVKALNRLFRGIVNTGFGQAYDITLESIGNATEEDIINLHHAKTAIYTYQNPLHIGAILAGASQDDLDLISEYAIPGGVAFQLQDDILGLYGDEEKTGKSAFSDLRQAKVTLLITKALELADSAQKTQIKKYWGKRDLKAQEAEIVRQIVKDTGSLQYSKKVSIDWAKKAQEAIPKMRKKNWDKDAIAYLNGIAQYMVEREV